MSYIPGIQLNSSRSNILFPESAYPDNLGLHMTKINNIHIAIHL